MKKLLFLMVMSLMIFSVFATCAFAAITTDTDYISYDFTGNTVTNSKASDITSVSYVPKDNEKNNPYKGSIVYGAFGKDATDAAYCFTIEWNQSALPTDTSIGTNIGSPFMQFATNTTTTGTDDVIHVSFNMYIDGNAIEAYGQTRPYIIGSTSLTQFSPTTSFLGYNGEGLFYTFGENITNIPFRPKQWSKVDVIFDAQATATVGGKTVNCALADLYINGVLVRDNIVLDGNNSESGYQTMGGLAHVRFFLNPKAVGGVYPKTSTYVDDIVVKTYRDGTMPVIYPEAMLSSTYTVDNESVINNTDNVVVALGYTKADFINSITSTDSYTYTYSVVDANGNDVSDNATIVPGYYLRAVNNTTNNVSYYLFSQNLGTGIFSDTLDITENEIRGYQSLTISQVVNQINFPYGSEYEIKNKDGSTVADNSKLAEKGMMITVVSEDKSKTKTYTLTDAYASASNPVITTDGYVTYDKFTTGSFTATVDVSNFTSNPIDAKVIVAQYSAAGRLKAYGISDVTSVEDTSSLTAEMTVKNASAGDFATVYVWDSVNIPLTQCATLYSVNPTVTSLINTYPTYTTKALTFSFDDGQYGNNSAGDKRLINIFDKYGIKSTWNLIANKIDASFVNNYGDDYFGDGDEVGNHSYSHTRSMHVEGVESEINGTMYPPMTTDECKYEISQGRAVLEELFGADADSFIWPFGSATSRSDYDTLIQYMKDIGIKYARPTGVTKSFEFPADWYEWKQTARIMYADDLLDSYLALPALSNDGLKQFSVWGHAYEVTYGQNAKEGEQYDDYMNYDELDAFCKAIYDEGETWFTTNAGLHDYYEATKALKNKNGVLYNDSDIDLYAVIDGQKIVIPAHGIGGKR